MSEAQAIHQHECTAYVQEAKRLGSAILATSDEVLARLFGEHRQTSLPRRSEHAQLPPGAIERRTGEEDRRHEPSHQ